MRRRSRALTARSRFSPTMPKPTTIMATRFSSCGGWKKPSRATSTRWRCKPRYVEAWNGLGTALKELKRHADALECYDKVLALMPD